jgi:hypothetical protein
MVTLLTTPIAIAAAIWAATAKSQTLRADDATMCDDDLFACARNTPISALTFGLWVLGDELRHALLSRQLLPSSAKMRIEVSSLPDREVLKLFVFDSGLQCHEIAHLIPNYLGRSRSIAGLYSSKSEIDRWTREEADNDTMREACLIVASYVAPRSATGIDDDGLRNLCAKAELKIVPIEKQGLAGKLCTVPLSKW